MAAPSKRSIYISTVNTRDEPIYRLIQQHRAMLQFIFHRRGHVL